MILLRLAVAGLFLVLTPSLAFACTCVVSGAAGLPFGAQVESRRIPPGPLGNWEGRDAIFVGQVLEVDPPESGMRPRLVRFVTEQSWRGALPDTLTVDVEGAPCAFFSVGQRYILAADVDSATPQRLQGRFCGMGYSVDSPAYTRLAGILGAPAWTAPPFGQRALNAGMVRLGTPRSPYATSTSVVFIAPADEMIARFEVADFSGGFDPQGARLLHLQPGLYHVRITWTDGRVGELYMSVRCEHHYANGTCQMMRSFRGLR